MMKFDRRERRVFLLLLPILFLLLLLVSCHKNGASEQQPQKKTGLLTGVFTRCTYTDEDLMITGTTVPFYDPGAARCRKLKSKALFAPENADTWLNYRKAFLSPPHGNACTDADFERVNAVLFPGGTEELEVYRWTTDWSDYFDEGREWWGTLCLTVYDKSLDRFVVIMASATD